MTSSSLGRRGRAAEINDGTVRAEGLEDKAFPFHMCSDLGPHPLDHCVFPEPSRHALLVPWQRIRGQEWNLVRGKE